MSPTPTVYVLVKVEPSPRVPCSVSVSPTCTPSEAPPFHRSVRRVPAVAGVTASPSVKAAPFTTCFTSARPRWTTPSVSRIPLASVKLVVELMSSRFTVFPSSSVSEITEAVMALPAPEAAVLMAVAMSSRESAERSMVTESDPIPTAADAGGEESPRSAATGWLDEKKVSLVAPSEVAFFTDVVPSRNPRDCSTPPEPSARLMPSAPVDAAVSTRRYPPPAAPTMVALTPEAEVPLLAWFRATATSSRVSVAEMETATPPTRNSPENPSAVVRSEKTSPPTFSRVASWSTLTAKLPGEAEELAETSTGADPPAETPDTEVA